MSDLEKRVEALESKINEMQEAKDMIKKLLMFFLGDSSSSGDTKALEEKTNALNQELQKLKKEKKSLEKELSNYKEIITHKNQEIESLKNEIKRLKEANKLSKLTKLYNFLNGTTKRGLANILKGDDELSLFASASINFNNLWEYAKYLNQEHKDRDFKILKEILEIVFNAIKDVQNYQKQDIKIGDSFDMDKMVRDNRSTTQSGKVTEIVLFGYTKGDKVKQKAIVKVA